MATRNDSLTIQQGTTQGFLWPIVDTSGNPVDVTGWTARSQVRAIPTAETVLHEWSSAEGNVELGPTGVILHVSPAASLAWTWTRGVYNVLLTDTTGNVYEIAQGTVTVDPSITR